MESYIFVNRFLRFSIFLCHYFTWLFSSSLPLFCHQYHHHCNRSHCCRWMLWFSCVWYNGAVWKNDSPYYIASLEKCKHEKTGGERWRDRESQKRRSETENYRYRRHIELTANFNYRKSTNTAIQDCNYILKSSVCGSHVWILRLINKISLLRSRSLSLSLCSIQLYHSHAIHAYRFVYCNCTITNTMDIGYTYVCWHATNAKCVYPHHTHRQIDREI